jgi:hypothetical protein
VLHADLHVSAVDARLRGATDAAPEAMVRTYVLPSKPRRCVLLACSCVAGAATALVVPQSPGAVSLVVALAVLAGISSMWSP